jgi:hypothetical protein
MTAIAEVPARPIRLVIRSPTCRPPAASYCPGATAHAGLILDASMFIAARPTLVLYHYIFVVEYILGFISGILIRKLQKTHGQRLIQ